MNQSDYSNTVLKETYSAGVLTLLSLPPLFNAIPYPNGHNQMNSGDTNFFRLSKEQGYNTYFYSSQPEDQMGMLNLLGKRWIDDVLFPTNLGFKQSESMPDEKLLPLFYKIDLNKGQNVVILHQRASHMPYGELLSEQDFVFGKEKLLDRYDSTIHKNDQFIEQVFTYLNQRKQNDWILIYTSDHGQYVTDKITNQGTTQLDNYLVPLFIYTPIDSLGNQTKEIFSYCQRANHYQLGTYLISLLGYDLSIGDCQKTYVNSNTLSGDLGYLEILQPSGETRYINPNEN
ncbi:sulfatase-like hydrolase/transferase [Seminibacterium arietis]|uniref:Sulfatase-like hydrolase/transferase n=1 Tax=Seminibacterium arietis TaxID=1173502 RepID=A0ABW3I8G6_9PAST